MKKNQKRVNGKIAKVEAPKREKFYGIVKVKIGQKRNWVSKQNKNGWSLGLAIGKNTFWLKNVRFKTCEEVKVVLYDGSNGTTFIHKATK